MAKIGFIGLGNMGLPMAGNLIKAGHEVTGFDLVDAQRDRLVEAGGEAASSPAQAVAGADAIITMLPEGRHVRDLYLDETGIVELAREGGANPLLIDCSTIDVATAREVAARAKAAGLDMLDAPVSGGVMGAEAASLAFMVGGEDGAFARGRALFEAMGKNIVHCGAAGTGQAAKICNNMILGISMIGVSEAFCLAESLGLDAQKLYDVSSKSSGQCWSLTTYCPVAGPVSTSPANRDYQPGFTAAMMLKDLKLAQEAASGTNTATPLGAAAQQIYQMMAKHHGSLDFSGVIRILGGRDN